MKLISVFFLLAALLFTSCEKNEDRDSFGNIVVTGKNKLIVSVVHHTYALKNIRVFIKHHATEFPGTDTTQYESSTLSDNSGVAVFDKLFEGDYFLFAKGFDPNISMNVIGAAAAPLNSSTLTNNESYVTLYVTE